MTQEAMTTGTNAENSTEGEATSTTVDTTATAAETVDQTAATPEATDQAKPQGAPEKYEFAAPEGKEFDAELIAQYGEVAKELNLSQEAAQKMIDTISPALAAKHERVLTEARAEWTAQVKADTEIGGANVAENIALANKAFQDFGTPELRTLLETTGLGDHPEMLRWAHRVGKAISEDGFVAGKGGNAPTDPAKTMFPNMA